MMGRMTMLSLLKQGGADEQSIKQLNRVLQGIKK
jgi:beta-galactosidase